MGWPEAIVAVSQSFAWAAAAWAFAYLIVGMFKALTS